MWLCAPLPPLRICQRPALPVSRKTFLNVQGEDDLLEACRRCYASLFTNRAISYRQEKGFDHMQVALSVGVQRMVRSDQGSAGVMFSIDTETGFPDVAIINAAWGAGGNRGAGQRYPRPVHGI